MSTFTEEHSVIVAMIFMGLGSAVTLAIRTFITRYVSSRADSVAADGNLLRSLARTYADQEAKALALRLDTSKAEGAMRILGLMAEVEATLFNWQLTAFFHMDELRELETAEDLALRDLKRVSTLLVRLICEVNSDSLLLGDELLVDVMSWVGKVREVVFDFHAAYQTSKKMHQEKPPSHNDRVTTVSSLMQDDIYPKMKSIGELRKQIRQELSKNVERSIAELVR